MEDFFGLRGYNMGGAGFSGAREDEEAIFDQGFP